MQRVGWVTKPWTWRALSSHSSNPPTDEAAALELRPGAERLLSHLLNDGVLHVPAAQRTALVSL